MSKVFQSKIQKRDIILVLAVLILIIINLIYFTKKFIKPKKQQQQQQSGTITVQEEQKIYEIPKLDTNEDIIKYLSTLKERDRMEFYCKEYLDYIRDGQYESAYNLLYDEFKNQYFANLDDFEEYVKKLYPHEFGVEYEDITRQGDIYVLKLRIMDVLGSRENEKSQRIVVRENYYNDFVISFQVI